MNLVYYTINKYYPTFITDEDIVQVGMVGLCCAAQNWDETKSKFSSYAINCILNEIRTEFRNRQKQVKTVSLDKKVVGEESDIGTLGDILVGDSDVNYVDLSSFYDSLTMKEKECFDLLQSGLSTKEIAKHFCQSYKTIDAIVRNIKLKWRIRFGN